MSTKHPRKQDADRLYEKYVKPLEKEQRGKYVLVTPDGQTIFTSTLLEAVQKAADIPDPNNFVFKVGDKVVGRI
jgi:hypothetical protein